MLRSHGCRKTPGVASLFAAGRAALGAALLACLLSASAACQTPQQAAAGAQRRGMLYVRSTPEAAEVTLGLSKVPFGRTPCLIRGLPPGPLPVAVELAGHVPFSWTVTVPPGGVEMLAVELQKVAVKVRLLSRPNGARVFLDGAEVGVAPVEIERVPPGRHTIGFQMDGYAPWVRQAEIATGMVNEIVAELAREPAAPGRAGDAAVPTAPGAGPAPDAGLSAAAQVGGRGGSFDVGMRRVRALVAEGRTDAARVSLDGLTGPGGLKDEAVARLARIASLRQRAVGRLKSRQIMISLRAIDPETMAGGDIVDVDDEGAYVSSQGLKVRVAWARIPKGAFVKLMQKCIGRDDAEDWSAYAELAMEAGDFEAAMTAISEVRRLGGEYMPLLRRHDALRAGEGPER